MTDPSPPLEPTNRQINYFIYMKVRGVTKKEIKEILGFDEHKYSMATKSMRQRFYGDIKSARVDPKERT